MKVFRYIITIFISFISFYCFSSDSLQMISNRLHQALTLNENGCYEIKIYAKPLTMRDTVERVSTVKIYPSSATAPQDSVRNFYYRCGFEPWGHLHHDGTNIWYNSDWKQMSVKEWDQNYFIRWLKHSGWYLYYPLLTKYNSFNLQHKDFEKYIIRDDSVFYFGKSYDKEDTLTKIYSVEINYKPRLHITVTEDFIGSDPLMSQYTRYEITETDGDTIPYIPKKLSSDYLSLFPGYSWKPIEDKKETDVPKVKEDTDAIPWKGLLLNGDTLRSSDMTGRFVVLDFWYKACGPCWAAIKSLSRYNSSLTENDVHIIGVNVGDWKVKEDAVAIFKRQGGNYQVLFDTEQQIRKDFEVSGYPTIFVIDREKNQIIFRQNGHPDDLIEKITESIAKARG